MTVPTATPVRPSGDVPAATATDEPAGEGPAPAARAPAATSGGAEGSTTSGSVAAAASTTTSGTIENVAQIAPVTLLASSVLS
ncbi:MAG: hypothetical protein ACRDL8_18580, partial [Solirubrobacteraceae bacterium]